VPGPWSLTDAAYEAFEQKLAWLLTASDAAYADACGEAPSYQMAYDDRMPTHTFLQHLIAEAVTGRKETASCV
jgi:hypothetical protein